jgi:peptide/nickel transport system substrate-binding protein
MSTFSKSKKFVLAVAVIVIILIAGISIYFVTQQGAVSTTSMTSTSLGPIPASFTYETFESIAYLDPGLAFSEYDLSITQNVYETLVWYNGSCSTCVIPWLAQSEVASPDLRTYQFTLRSGITFADGEPLNSSAVYFSLNRLLLEDGSTPVSHATQASWIIQQLLNTSLSSALCCSQTYGPSYYHDVMNQNFVEITGPLTFTLHVMNPNAAFDYLLTGVWASILAPDYVMTHDLALWKEQSAGYSLPYPNPSGGLMDRMNQYLMDEVATCNAGSTPSGCGNTYLDKSLQGSQAGTGPYTIQSFDASTGDIQLVANPTYWGGPYQFSGGAKIVPKITSVLYKFVPDQTTREIDLRNSATSGQAMAIDVANTNIYDIADRNTWLQKNQLVSIIPGVSIYGPYDFYGTLFDPFDTNVTSATTGEFYKFQPFADLRFRLAFADSVNMTSINLNINNNLAPVAINVVPPGIPPPNSFNSTITPRYAYNPSEVANLLLDAMYHPLTQFTFTNGTQAPPGFFDNTFGCSTLNSNNLCSSPVPQTIQLYFPTGDTVDEHIFNEIAGTVNNVSATFNMGLTVSLVPLPLGQLTAAAFTTPTHFYMYSLGYEQDYPWVTDFLGPMLVPGQAYPGPDGWNLPAMQTLYQQAVNASGHGDIAGIIAASNAMNTLANQNVLYLWTFYTTNFITMTSNVQGLYYNPSINPAGPGGVGPQYFATLY